MNVARGLRALDAETERELEQVARALRALPRRFEWVAICGAQPPDLATDASARLVAAARADGRRVAIDTRGTWLRAAWAAQPDLVRVNEQEYEEAVQAVSRQLMV